MAAGNEERIVQFKLMKVTKWTKKFMKLVDLMKSRQIIFLVNFFNIIWNFSGFYDIPWEEISLHY